MAFLRKMFDAGARFERRYARALQANYRVVKMSGDQRVDIENGVVEVRGLRVALTHARRVLITGAPGAGKTTALLNLALRHARRLLSDSAGARVPIFFSARDGATRPDDAVRALGIDAPRDYLAALLASERALVLIDDLDALPPPTRDEWLLQFGGAHIVATASTKINGLSEFALPGLRDNDIQEFAEKQLEKRANDFLAALKANGVPRALTSNPLTLTLLEQVWLSDAAASAPANELFEAHGIKPLPTRRAELFNASAALALGSDEEAAKMLEGVALAIQRGKPAPAELLNNSRGFLCAAQNNAVEFSHALWQYYFAARALRHAPNLEPLLEHLDDPAWAEVVWFYAGLGDAAPLVAALIARKDFARAGLAIAHAAEISKETREAVTSELMEHAWNGDAAAIRALAEMHNEVAVDYLAARLKEKDPKVRARAVEILGELQLDRGIDYLLPQLRDVSGDVRDKVVQALGHARTDRVVEPLLVALRGDPRVGTVDTRLRIAAARALGEVATEKAFAALIVDLQIGEPEVREVAAEALKRIKTPLMVKPLRSILQTGDPMARQYAEQVLAVVDGQAVE
ncbi:MAG: HEAT repeat domain-containing protein [Chloroflexi bacterium]|nr:HEAT repeat domain-containing protein [Chloroflexota bacterium]